VGYEEEDYLPLSGIQHLAFCPRQWGLIHIDQQWSENLRTAEGKILHRNVDDPTFREKRGDTLVIRAVPIASSLLGLSGTADMVEFRHVENRGVCLKDEIGYWIPFPVEYKAGRPKPDDRDEIQLCAQAICFEEMFHTDIPVAYFYYGQPRRRMEVLMSPELRKRVRDLSTQMHELFNAGVVPQALRIPGCRNCSLSDLCLPDVVKRGTKAYIEKELNRNFPIENGDE
jgi:CRISPR-associated exonuclease Cas4